MMNFKKIFSALAFGVLVDLTSDIVRELINLVLHILSNIIF